jgi:serine/threonine protein kinase
MIELINMLRKVIIFFYVKFLELSRIIFNKIFYTIFGFIIKVLNIKTMKVYGDSNGWFLTYKYKNHIYKLIGPFILLRLKHSMKDLKESLLIISKKISEQKINYLPTLDINTLYLKFEFKENTVSIQKHIINIETSNEKIIFFIKLLNTIEDFHNLGFAHGDLKPKNILVNNNNNIFIIDLEDIKPIDKKNKVKDYEKLLSRIIYYTNTYELNKIIQSIHSDDCKEFIKKNYQKKYDIKKSLEVFDTIEFEKEYYAYDEDVDITVPTYSDFVDIVQYLKKLNLDYQIFYCCTDDFKIYIYNINYFYTVDIHIKENISVYYLLYLKYFKNQYKNIFITGPDGVGKTTAINKVLNGENKVIYNMLNIKLKHANRFVQEKSIIKDSKLERFLTCRYFGCLLKKYLIILKNKIKTKSMVNLYDRSFVDVLIFKKNILYNMLSFIFGHIKDIILLYDNAFNIIHRKQELKESEINKYYLEFDKYQDNIQRIQVKDMNITQYKLNSIIIHKILTKEK